MECQYCKKVFPTKYLLAQHQTKAKYCLDIQGISINSENQYECIHCLKKLCSNERLNTHLTICKIKQQDEIKDEFEKEIQNYKQQLSEKDNEVKILKDKLAKFEDAVIASALSNQTKHEDQAFYQQLADLINRLPKEEKQEEHAVSTLTLNSVEIIARHPDHYVNATDLCHSSNKKFNDWSRLDSTKQLIDALSTETGIPVSGLIEIKRGSASKFHQGTWIHPDLAMQLAQWISPCVGIQISHWLTGLIKNGTVNIDIALLKETEKQLFEKDQRIKQLEQAFLSKQKREEITEQNVIYLITTDDHLKRRTYIIGKAKNLTNRLSTYNKTCDHHVVYYRECKSEDDMAVAETMILGKLRGFREQANRDRFILPDDKEVEFFIDIIDQCINFLR